MLMQYVTQPCITLFHFLSLIPQCDITCVHIWSMAVATVHGHGPAKIGNYMDFDTGTQGISWPIVWVWLSYGWPMVGQWLANGWPMVGQWFANGWPMVDQGLANGWSLVDQWLANGWPIVGQ